MSTKKIVVLSDVHIGTNVQTNWYQRSLHEPFMLAFFDYLKQQASEIGELIILGDLVDQWTYLPSVRPPAFADIAAANPAIFGANAALMQAHAALEGRVTWLGGNHDMGVTAADLGALRDPAGRTLRFVAETIYEPEIGRGRVACTHGHIYSTFNAPDRSSGLPGGLPIGHFVTRLSALHASRRLAAGQTVADLPESGDPTGWLLAKDALVEVFQEFLTGERSLADLVLGALLEACGESRGLPFTLPDGSSITAGEAIDAYVGFYERWKDEQRFERAIYGRDPAMPALVGTDARNDLRHFALVLGARYPVVVMGHTHAPVDKDEHLLLSAGCLYANSGFGCPSRPDMQNPDSPKHPSFVELAIDETADVCTATVRYVAAGPGALRVAPEPLTAPVRIALH